MTTSIRTTMGLREWGLLIALSILWGGSFFFVEVAVAALPPLTIVTLRVGIAAVVLWGVAMALGLRPPRSIRTWTAFLVMGVLNNVMPFALIVWGQTRIGAGLASILNATTPLFTVVVAGLLLADEKLTAARLAGVVIGLFGVVVIVAPGAPDGMDGGTLAQLAILGAALSYAFAAVFGRRFKTMGLHPMLTAAGQVTASTVVLLPVTGWVDGVAAPDAAGLETWAAVLGLAVLSTAAAYILYFRILAAAGATNLLLVAFLIPVSAILLGSLVLGEALAAWHFAGMALIGLGLSVVDGRPWRQWRPRRVLSRPGTPP